MPSAAVVGTIALVVYSWHSRGAFHLYSEYDVVDKIYCGHRSLKKKCIYGISDICKGVSSHLQLPSLTHNSGCMQCDKIGVYNACIMLMLAYIFICSQ